MDEYLNYDSAEILDIKSNVDKTVNLIDNDVKSSLNKDFKLLEDLELYDNGLSLFKDEVISLMTWNDKLSSLLLRLDNKMEDLEKRQLDIIDSSFNTFTDSLTTNSSELIDVDRIKIDKINDGKAIINTYVNEVLISFSYDRKKEILKNILNGENSLSLLTSENESNALVYKLTELLSEKYDINLSKLSNEEEKEIQKDFFEVISNNDTNIFNELEEDTFLSGYSYYKQIANKNGISVSDLLFDSKNKDLFINTTKEIYLDNEIDVLTEKEVNSVKNYIDKLAKYNDTNANGLFNSSNNYQLIKGGIL